MAALFVYSVLMMEKKQKNIGILNAVSENALLIT